MTDTAGVVQRWSPMALGRCRDWSAPHSLRTQRLGRCIYPAALLATSPGTVSGGLRAHLDDVARREIATRAKLVPAVMWQTQSSAPVSKPL
jgi:hypothetical protein